MVTRLEPREDTKIISDIKLEKCIVKANPISQDGYLEVFWPSWGWVPEHQLHKIELQENEENMLSEYVAEGFLHMTLAHLQPVSDSDDEKSDGDAVCKS